VTRRDHSASAHMNDRDWFKKFRRNPRGGCAATIAITLGLLVAALVG
jgi:hypothetical protein